MAARTFIAIDIAPSIRRRLLAAADKIDQQDVKVRWTADENIHITLKFIGDVEDSELNDLCQAAVQVAEGIDPFELSVCGLLCQPPAGRQLRMVWAGVEDSSGSLAALHKALEDAVAELGFAREHRKFNPHLTLGRVKFAPEPDAVRESVARSAENDFGTQQCDEIVVYTSTLAPTGPRYTVAARASLGGH